VAAENLACTFSDEYDNSQQIESLIFWEEYGMKRFFSKLSNWIVRTIQVTANGFRKVVTP
jgi:hypothetical protein